jgi:hypothetical protein
MPIPSNVRRAMEQRKRWDENQVTRDENGRFTSSDGGGARSTNSSLRRALESGKKKPTASAAYQSIRSAVVGKSRGASPTGFTRETQSDLARRLNSSNRSATRAVTSVLSSLTPQRKAAQSRGFSDLKASLSRSRSLLGR